ncbi:hypothetical protein REG_0982 [Candidatus Regiella insecticola LSR1]|uniref:Uncharacterized protein n=1 Tax=Candidatus Regiella insecticola LSR1 TaxID=663321 RepID=E0WSP7_9ENTR|nr:hypothetical protein [Candidatus Regiella insecticola]EFL92016.1 hypothetical protein REG_0982 [Candidatus Regiella insecticola LSR1]
MIWQSKLDYDSYEIGKPAQFVEQQADAIMQKLFTSLLNAPATSPQNAVPSVSPVTSLGLQITDQLTSELAIFYQQVTTPIAPAIDALPSP